MSLKDFQLVAQHPDTRIAALSAFRSDTRKRQSDDDSGRSAMYRRDTALAVREYRAHLDSLQSIHARHQEHVDIIGSESALVASYILHAKAISLLKMACDCLEHQYWDTLVLLRPIDEALDLSRFFSLTEDTDSGRKHLARWFREDVAPANVTCREGIAKALRLTEPRLAEAEIGRVLAELHHAKSKPVHNAHHHIMEVYRARVDRDVLVPQGFDYGPCSWARKVFEIAGLFRLSVHTAIQFFILDFHCRLPFSQSELKLLTELELSLR